MFPWLFWLVLAFALIDWVATGRNWRRVRWLTKPATLILLIAWFTQLGGWRGPLIWFGLGLVFSLLGDVFLLLPERYFIPGVAAFMLTHIFYIIGFTRQPFVPGWVMILPIILVGTIFLFLSRSVRAGLRQRGSSTLIGPVMVYAVVLSLMWLSALTTLWNPGWSEPSAAIVSLGAGLFFLSDALLSYTRFVRDLPCSNLMVMITYHIGQILLVFGILLQYA
jgi:uncharacterized membrane protein YhhN